MNSLRTTLKGAARAFDGGEIELVVFWVVVPHSLVVVNELFGGRAASIFRVEFVIKEMYPLHCCLPTEVPDT
jgi:hypothetical protein